jgi:hypothetical protein
MLRAKELPAVQAFWESGVRRAWAPPHPTQKSSKEDGGFVGLAILREDHRSEVHQVFCLRGFRTSGLSSLKLGIVYNTIAHNVSLSSFLFP